MDIVFKNHKNVFNYRVVAVWLEKNHVLLHKETEDTHWSLPGGRVAMGEESISSLKREMMEELGVKVNIKNLLLINENFFSLKSLDFHEIGLYYEVTTDTNPIFKKGPFYGLEGERLVYQWFPVKEITDLELYPQEIKEMILNKPEVTQHLVSK
ncbi:NUDIX hydrolase [Rossellomorea aquimaris]|uniref:NUDIX hydrolase n=1 Tax=Rossellomorea aquimaris TaxID=189382 RepID=UPI0007D0B13E|nr:NUDIX hydrolase [Rossellomorea aquimaris]